MTPRERYEAWEAQWLSPHAVKSTQSRGRQKSIAPCALRTCFQRDRDRILHSKAFRRLKHKTQMFLAPSGDHYRTRLTHTMEVAQIARTIARALRLNEDLTEAIAMGHDLGHTPFGHTGERSLDAACSIGFSHNVQSLRVVDVLEREGEGLNLCAEVRDGIAHHTGDTPPFTLEGRVVRFSDRIAYVNHDIDDAVRGGILCQDDIPRPLTDVLGETHGKRIDTMIRDVVAESEGKDEIAMSAGVGDALLSLRDFMFAKVYNRSINAEQEKKAAFVIQHLFAHYLDAPDALPEEYQRFAAHYGREQAVCDYIAGMSDQYALRSFQRLFVPFADPDLIKL